MGSYIAGLMVGISCVAFGLGFAAGAKGGTVLGSAWRDGAVLLFIGANILLLSAVGLRP